MPSQGHILGGSPSLTTDWGWRTTPADALGPALSREWWSFLNPASYLSSVHFLSLLLSLGPSNKYPHIQLWFRKLFLENYLQHTWSVFVDWICVWNENPSVNCTHSDQQLSCLLCLHDAFSSNIADIWGKPKEPMSVLWPERRPNLTLRTQIPFICLPTESGTF